MIEHSGLDEKTLVSGSKLVLSSPLEKLQPFGGNYMNFLGLQQTFLSKEQKANKSSRNHFVGAESTPNLSMSSLGGSDQKKNSQSNLCMHPTAKGFHYDNSIFSSSLSEAFGNKLRLLSNDTCFVKSLEATNSIFVEDEPLESMKELEAQMIGDLLPNDDDLFSGVIGENIDCVPQTNSGDEDDLFYSGGGMEMEPDESSNRKKTLGFPVRGTLDCQIDSVRNIVATESFHTELSSRTLIVRNVNSIIEDTDLKILFEQFGDIHALYTANKHLGFIMVSYYDIRASKNAKRALQDRLLRQQKLDIQFYFAENNSTEKDIKHGTLTVINLDSIVSEEQLLQIFGSYGEIKEVLHDPCNQNKIAIEFYDVRAADAALCALNMSIIAGKRIMVEHGCPGAGWKRKSGSHCHSSSVCTVPATYAPNTSMGIDNGSIHNIFQNQASLLMENVFPRAPTMSRNTSSIKAMEGNNRNHSIHNELSCSLGQMNFGFQCIPATHPHSLPELNDGLINSIPFSPSSTISPLHASMNSRISDAVDNQHFRRVGAGCINSSFEHKEAFGVSGNGSYPVNGQQYVLNNSSANFHQLPGSLPWRNLPSFTNNISSPLPPQSHGLPRGPSHMMNAFVPLHQHHVGSDPALKSSLWDKCNAYTRDSFDVPFHPGSVGNMGLSASSPIHSLGIHSQNMYPHPSLNYIDPLGLPAHVGSPLLQQRSYVFHGRNNTTSAPASYDISGERIRSRRNDSSSIQADGNKQFELDIDRIIHGQDSRTTLMIKNIPNKYTAKMLIATIDEQYKASYDFIYLPIDFKNKCNVGYAFINLTHSKHIIPFYQAFNGKKWEKFNSEKVASLAYARIQGRDALICHFQNSSLMNEDKRCRPILFHSDGPNAGGQEPFPMGNHIRSRPGRSKVFNNEENYQMSPSESDSGNVEERSNSTESPSSNKGSE